MCARIEPHYPKPTERTVTDAADYFLQQWFNLADPVVEQALCGSAALRQFVGISLGTEPVPDETTVCKFRHLLEEHTFGARNSEDAEFALASDNPEAIDEFRAALQMGHPSWYPIFINIHPDLQATPWRTDVRQLLATLINN